METPKGVAGLVEVLQMALSWVWVLFLSLWGGLVDHMMATRGQGIPIKEWLLTLLSVLLISGFVGVMTTLACLQFELGKIAIGFLAGMSGNMGGASVRFFRRIAKERAYRMAGLPRRRKDDDGYWE